MNRDQLKETSERLEDPIIPPERGEIAPVNPQSPPSNKKKGLGERLIYLIVRLGPRPFGLLSIVFLSTGINLMTALPDASSQFTARLITATSLTLAGALFFIVSTNLEKYYEGAQEQQRTQIESRRLNSEERVARLLDLAADLFKSTKRRLWVNFLSLFLAIALSLVGLGALVFGLSQANRSAIQNTGSPNAPASNEKPLRDEETKQ
jgi:hypothetical protein